MKTVEITQNDKIAKEETKDQQLTRNLRECVNIFNNIVKECINSEISMKIEITGITPKESTIVNNGIGIKIHKLEKTTKQQF